MAHNKAYTLSPDTFNVQQELSWQPIDPLWHDCYSDEGQLAWPLVRVNTLEFYWASEHTKEYTLSLSNQSYCTADVLLYNEI